MKTHRIVLGLALGIAIGATVAPLTASAETDLDAFRRRITKYAVNIPAPGKQGCVCHQAGMVGWAGVMNQDVSGSTPKRVLVSCLMPGFDAFGETAISNSCYDFTPLAK